MAVRKLVAPQMTPQQKAFYRWVVQTPKSPKNQHGMLEAGAGCGKTTTLATAVNYSNAERIMVLAFGRDIVKEMKKRITNPNARVVSAHSAGMRLVKDSWGQHIRVLEDNERARTLTRMVTPSDMPKGVQNVVSYLHSKVREILPLVQGPEEIIELMWKFDIHSPEYAEYDWPDDALADYAHRAVLKAAERPLVMGHGMDFSDMIFLPIRNGLMKDLCDELYVDEVQDMSPAQVQLMHGICPKGRIVMVGDDNQAIYAWRGAASGGMGAMKAKMDPAVFPLTRTFRCAKAIVATANVYAPDLTATDTAQEGVVRDLPMDKMMVEVAPGDFILSRTTRPLVKIAMKLLRDGKRARIAGRDMSKGLLRVVDKLVGQDDDVPVAEFLTRLASWREQQVDRYAESDTPQRAEQAMDQSDILRELADDAESLPALRAKMGIVFAEDGSGTDVIMCSTVHKAKGLERERVYALQDTFQFGRSKEENNIIYVAITRAKRELVWVRGK